MFPMSQPAAAPRRVRRRSTTGTLGCLALAVIVGLSSWAASAPSPGSVEVRAAVIDGLPRLAWNSTPGVVYEILERESLEVGEWQSRGRVVADATTTLWNETLPVAASRFYQVVGLPGGRSLRVTFVHSSRAPLAINTAFRSASYPVVRGLLEGLGEVGELRVPLPLEDLRPFPDLTLPDVEVHFDDRERAITMWGRASLLDQPVELLFTADWGNEPGAVATFTLGIKLSNFGLGDLDPGFAATPLGSLSLKDSVLILARANDRIDPRLLPGRAFAFFEGATIDVERGVNFFKVADFTTVLPIVTGLKLLGIPEARLALQGFIGMDPNRLFGTADSTAPPFLHLRSELSDAPVTGMPGWLTTRQRRMDLLLSAEGIPATGLRVAGALRRPGSTSASSAPFLFTTVTDELILTFGAEQLEFEAITDLATLESGGTNTVLGVAKSPWTRPFGIDWLTLDGVTVELAYREGEVTHATLLADFAADRRTGTATIDLPADGHSAPEIRLSTDAVTLADLASWARTFGLTIPLTDLPGDLTLRDPQIALRMDPQPSFTVTGKWTILGGLEAELLVSMVVKDGKVEPLIAARAGPLSLGRLLPAVESSPLGNWSLPMSSFGTAPAGSERTLSSSEMSPSARRFFERQLGTSTFDLPVGPEVRFSGDLPLTQVPPRLLQALGLEATDRVLVTGPLGLPLASLLGSGPLPVDHLRLEASLPLRPMPGLPPILEPTTILGRTLVLTYASGQLEVTVETVVGANLAGNPSRFVFTTSLTKTAPGETLKLTGVSATPWNQPFGVPWLTMNQVVLDLAVSAAASQAALSGQIDVGGTPAAVAIDLRAVAGTWEAGFRATIERLAFRDLITWIENRVGVPPLGQTLPEGILELRRLQLDFETGPTPQFTLSAGTTLLEQLPCELLLTLVADQGEWLPILGFRAEEFSLGTLSPQFAGGFPGDLPLPAVAFTTGRSPATIPASRLSPTARAFYQPIYGRPDYSLKVEAGMRLAGQLPLSRLPAKAVSALGLPPDQPIALEGAIGVSLGMLTGGEPVEVKSLELGVELPAARPVAFPTWLPADPSVQRTLGLRFQNLPGPENSLALRVTDAVTVNLDGAPRRFRLTSSIASTGDLAFVGTMTTPWVRPFGVEWLTLEEVVLSLAVDGTQSVAALRSSFPLGGKTIELGIALESQGGELAAKLTGTVDHLALGDVIELVRKQFDRPLFTGTPPADFAELNEVTMILRLGRVKTMSLGARSRLAGQEAELLWSIEGAAGQEPAIVLGIQPKDWSLTGAFPSLSNPVTEALKPSTPTLVLARAPVRKESSRLTEEEGAFYGRSQGSGNGVLELPSGLSLVGSIPLDGLPADSPLRDLLNVLGMQGNSLQLAGNLGNSLDLITGGGGVAGALRDLSLRVALPPMRPKGTPPWFVSGQLALEVTGAPSVAVGGEVTVNVEGDILTFSVQSGLAFPGPTLQLVGGLQAAGGWVSPFGVEWLTLHELIVLIGVEATGSLKLGFSGDLIVGEKDLRVAALVALSPAGVPTNLILDGHSTEGFAMSDLVALQQRLAAAANPASPRLPIDALPEMALRNLTLKFAPRPEPALGIERGLAVSGDLHLQPRPGEDLTHLAGIDLAVTDGEIRGSGILASGTLGPLTWRDPRLDLLITLKDQRLAMGGAVTAENLAGDLNLAVTRESMSYDLAARIRDQFGAHLQGHSEFDLRGPGLPVDARMLSDFLSDASTVLRERFGEVADQGRAAIANAERLLENARALHAAKELQLSDTIRGFLDELDLARRAFEAARDARDAAKAARDAALAARNAAWSLYESTPAYQAALKAARYSDYLAKASVYSTRQAAYLTAQARYLTAKTAYEEIPPVEERPAVVALRAEVVELSRQREARRQELQATTDQYRAVLDAVRDGTLGIEDAGFSSTLTDLVAAGRVTMTVTMRWAEQRHQSAADWDFHRSVRDNLEPAIASLLRNQGIPSLSP